MKKLSVLITAACLVFVGIAPTQSAYGIEREDSSRATKPEKRENQSERAEKVQKTRSQEARKLNKKQQACKNREAEIKQTLARTSERAQKHIEVFDKIVERTQDFYTRKGKVLDTYEPLVTDVAAKRAAAEKAVANLKAVSEVFTCDTDNPQASLQAVRDVLKAKRDTMKAYKTSVKSLIVGVKSVQGTVSSSDNKEVRQ